jgi:hypothetical protein
MWRDPAKGVDSDANEAVHPEAMCPKRFYEFEMRMNVPLVLLGAMSIGLVQLAPSIGSFATMKEFYLRNNALESLPDEFAKLTALDILNLGANKFSQFPSQVLALTNLRCLQMSNNQLVALPRELASMHTLTIASFKNNMIQWLPVELGGWAMNIFRDLDLTGNLLPQTSWPDQERNEVLKEIFRATKHVGMIRYAAATVCIALQQLELPALLTLMIIDELFENDIRMWAKWELITAVKHFHARHT